MAFAIKYSGEPTTAIRISGPIFTAIMSLSTLSPRRTPASKRPSTILTKPLSTTSSTLISGYFLRNGFNFGHNKLRAACSPAESRILPDTVPFSWRRVSNSCSRSARRGSRQAIIRSPASVGATLRVVRVRRRRFNLSSSPLIAWLSAD